MKDFGAILKNSNGAGINSPGSATIVHIFVKNDFTLWGKKSDGTIFLIAGGTASDIWERGTGTLSAQTKGTSCLASGDYSIAEGYLNESSGIDARSCGELNLAAGTDSVAEGFGNFALAEISRAEGANSVSYLYGTRVFSSGELVSSNDGGSEKIEAILRTITSDAVKTEMKLNFVNAPSPGGEILDPSLSGFDSLLWSVKVRFTGIQHAGIAGTVGDSFDALYAATFKYVGGVLSIVGAALPIYGVSDAAAAAWQVFIEPDGTNTYLKISAQGEANKSILWSASIDINQVAFNT